MLALRHSGYGGEIHLFADNRHPPYNPMLGTYVVSGKIPLERAFPFGDQISFYDANEVTAHLGETVAELDAEEQTFSTVSGATFSYDRCLVATGARPAVPPIAGLREALSEDGSDRRVFTLQTVDDATRLKQVAASVIAEARSGDSAPKAAVVGASFAGVKIAAVLHGMGMRVTLVEREPSILPLSAHPDCARILERHLLEEGYDLRLGAALSAVTPGSGRVRLDFGALPGAADPEGSGGTACEDQQAQETVELVVACTGNRPALSFLKQGQVNTGVGVLIDERSRSNIPTLYAAGDVAQGKNLMSGRHEIIGLWASARAQGRAAGRSMAGIASGYRGNVPSNITHVGRLLFASVGCLRDYDHIETSNRDGAYELRAWQEGRLTGINLVNRCLDAGVTKQALLRAATGATEDTEATWTSLNA